MKTELTIQDWGLCLGRKVLVRDKLLSVLVGLEACCDSGQFRLIVKENNQHIYKDKRSCMPIFKTLDQMTWQEKSRLAFDYDIDEDDFSTVYELYDELMDYAGYAEGVDRLTRLGYDIRDWIDAGLAIKYDPEKHGDWV